MPESQKIFTGAYVDDLYAGATSGRTLDSYIKAEIEIDADRILPTPILVSDTAPILKTKPEDDIQSAIDVYEFLGADLTETQASDARLWTYLSHVTFRKYTMERWSLDNDAEDASKINSIKDHWFISENDRRLRRHSIARLWWAAKLTAAPWESDKQFSALENLDKYIYTRMLLHTQDIFQSTIERSITGRSRKVLITFLEILRKNNETADDRSGYRNLLKEINLIAGYKKITQLSFDQIYGIMEKLI